MGSFTQPILQTAELHHLLDEFLPNEGQIYWFDREQPTNWGEDVQDADDINLSEEDYIKTFRSIEATPYIRGYFLLCLSEVYFLGGTFEEARLKMEVQGEQLLDDPL